MAIRYDANYNREISRVVKNFNNKRNRAIKRGLKNVPAPIKVSDLKARYRTISCAGTVIGAPLAGFKIL